MGNRCALAALVALLQILSSTVSAAEIHDAAREGDLKTVKALVEAAPELVNARDRDRPLLFPALTVAPGGGCSGRAMGWRERLNLSP